MPVYKTTGEDLTSIADAIRTRSGTSASLAYPGDFVNAIRNIPTDGGNPVAERGDVNFVDYDGTIRYSYSTSEFMTLTALPLNPSHTGLTAQGWNWNLTNAKAHVSAYKKLDIGQMYTTSDGKTRIYIHLTEGRTSPMLGVCPNGTVDVDWGDGSTHSTLTGSSVDTVQWTSTHNYAEPGYYVISLTVTGSMGIYGEGNTNTYSGLLRHSSSADKRNSAYSNSIVKVEIGDNVSKIRSHAFYYCTGLSEITIPITADITTLTVFGSCYSLKYVVIPDGATKIESYTFDYCYNLKSVSIPHSVKTFSNNAFSNCDTINNIIIPDGATSLGSNIFMSCDNLRDIVIPESIENSYSNTFYACYTLQYIRLPNNIKTIHNSEFESCSRLTSFTTSENITSFGLKAFRGCSNLKEIHVRSSTPPQLFDNLTFDGVPEDFVIYVPYSADHSILNAYQTNSGWSLYASSIQEETP